MLSAWIIGALAIGALAWRLGLPPLVGFLLSGFLFGAFGAEPTDLLHEWADAGVLILLFAVGLKLRFKTLARGEVWGTAVVHLLFVAAITGTAIVAATALTLPVAVMMAIALAFSSTVFAAKVLDTQHELRAVHGRIAIGILIVQDLVAVALLAMLSAEAPSPFAALVLLLPLARPVFSWIVDFVGHGELLVLLGAGLAIAVGGTGFELLGLSPELGALLLGTVLSGHRRAEELSAAIWGLKEFLLVAFFLSIGLSGTPDWAIVERAAWLMLLLPVKAVAFFALLLAFGLRARTSFLTAVTLTTYSEFGLILASEAVEHDLLGDDWLIATAVTVALSFVIAAPLNAYAHPIFARLSRRLEKLERDRRHPDDEPIHLGSAEILIVGMGRLGTGAYDYLHKHGELVVGADSDPGKIEAHRKAGRRVVYADSEDAGFWQLLNVDRLTAIMLTFPDFHAKRIAGRELRRRGYAGHLSAIYVFPEERDRILEAGFDATYYYFTEAGVGFARDTVEALRNGPAADRSG